MTDEQRYIIPERIRDIQRGSMEDRSRRVRQWVDENVEGGAVVATREESFVVIDGGDGRAIEFECRWDGLDLEVVGERVLEDVSVPRPEMGRYVCDRLREMSGAMIDGDLEEARRKYDDVEGLLDKGAKSWWVEGLTDRLESGDDGMWRDVLAETDDVGSAAIRHGVSLDRYDHRTIGESVLIRGSVQEIITDADSLSDCVEEKLDEGLDGAADKAARSLDSEIRRLVDLAERAEPYLSVTPDEAVEAFRDAAAQALYECARAYAAIEGLTDERRNAGRN